MLSKSGFLRVVSPCRGETGLVREEDQNDQKKLDKLRHKIQQLMHFNRVIAFTDTWWHTALIALIVGVLIAFLMVFLQPFDTYGSIIAYKSLKLAGYSLAAMIPILLIHPLERVWYRLRKQQWRLFNEILVLVGVMIGVSLLAYLYHAFLFAEGLLSLLGAGQFFVHLTLPFAPILLPLLVYLRYRFGKIVLVEAKQGSTAIQIQGFNQGEELAILPSQFVYAQSQQNYVEVHYLDEERQMQKKLIRSTLGHLMMQLPNATRFTGPI